MSESEDLFSVIVETALLLTVTAQVAYLPPSSVVTVIDEVPALTAFTLPF